MGGSLSLCPEPGGLGRAGRVLGHCMPHAALTAVPPLQPSTAAAAPPPLPNSACRGCVGSRTLEWVKSTAAHLPRVPSLAFIHIPVPQLVDAYNHFPTVGQKNEGVTCPEAADPGVFAALK